MLLDSHVKSYTENKELTTEALIFNEMQFKG